MWARNSKRRLALAALVMLAIPGTASAGIVVSSSGPSSASFPPGKKLPDDARITLKAADSVTILDAKGTRVLRGAGTFPVGAQGTVSRATTFVALTRQRGAQRVRTGAVRGVNGKPVSPNLWYVDLSHSGTFCVTDPAAVRVWRPEKDGVASYVATSKHGDKSVTLSFTDGVTVAPWDTAAAPISSGDTFTVAKKDGPVQSAVTFAVIPAQDYAPEDLAAALLSKGCTGQVDLLAASLALPQDDAPAGPATP